MAILENIQHQFFEFKPSSKNSEYGFIPNTNKEIEESFPQIFLSDGEPWHEVNQYAFARYYDQQKDLKTVNREMTHLARYANWLEEEGLHWLHFPKRKYERCLFKFRGYLIKLRDEGLLAPSTTSQTMRNVVAFYRWASNEGYAQSNSKLFDDENKVIYFFDKVGFRRTMEVTSSELSIPNRPRTGITLENGLTPINQASTKILMDHLSKHSNHELHLMFKTALLTGCRHETISTLNIDALKKSYPDPLLLNIMRVEVGPGTGVKTKFNVYGSVYFPKSLVIELIEYFNSAKAILRRSKAKNSLQRNIFLTSHNNRYTKETFGTLLHQLKEDLIESGHTEFGRFQFHQLRATFGTMMMRALLKTQGVSSLNAIEFVREAMLHKEASTTWKYIKFIENEPIEEQFLQTLWEMFTGPQEESQQIIDQLTCGEVIGFI
jgi:integrase